MQMAKIQREKIALGLFAACVALILAGIGAYFVFGHSWNYAASHIDDVAGELDGYCVVLVEGQGIPEKARVNSEGMLTRQPKSVSGAIVEYRGKDASVFNVSMNDLRNLAHPVILEQGDYRVGISFASADSKAKDIQADCDYLHAHGCDVVMVASDGFKKVSKITGADIFLHDASYNIPRSQERRTDAHICAVPPVGEGLAIVVSPTELITTRTITG